MCDCPTQVQWTHNWCWEEIGPTAPSAKTKLDCQYGLQTFEKWRKPMGWKRNAPAPQWYLHFIKWTQYWSSSSSLCLFRKASSLLIAVSECNLSLVLPASPPPPHSLLCGSFKHASHSLGSVSHWGMGHGTGDQLFANVDTCQSRLGLFGARQAAGLDAPSL